MISFKIPRGIENIMISISIALPILQYCQYDFYLQADLEWMTTNIDFILM